MKITIAQLNPTVGDLEGNFLKLKNSLQQNAGESDLIIFPELFLCGYPPRDLLEKKHFIDSCEEKLEKVCELSCDYPSTAIVLGSVSRNTAAVGKRLFNSAIFVLNGSICLRQHKKLLPTYDVFDEERYFQSSNETELIEYQGYKIGLSVCEDMWNVKEISPKTAYKEDPIQKLVEKGADLILNISASPYYLGKEALRFQLLNRHAMKHQVPIVHVNQVGGNDELIFDGRSVVLNKNGEVLHLSEPFKESVTTFCLEEAKVQKKKEIDQLENLKNALVLGVRDYLRKCGFQKAVIGLSGGIDSALTAYLATQAIGAENVLGITMPSDYSSKGSIEDSEQLAKNLKMECRQFPIKDVFCLLNNQLQPHFDGKEQDVTEENLQARIRGVILMAFSNKFRSLLLSTGNKSEMAVGYCTLYGDMNGGMSVISDLPKTIVYELCRYLNREKEIIPQEIIDKEPSAELRPEQKDQDSLPPYEVLDGILELYIEENLSIEAIVQKGYEEDMVRWIVNKVKLNEYKRRQAAPGLKVTPKAFGVGRRIPVAAKYQD